MFPLWLEIALGHLRAAQEATTALARAHADGKDKEQGRYLEAECTHAMQSIVASATAIDAFYASIKSFAKYSKEEIDAIRSAKTSRPARIKETIRRVFSLGTQSMSLINKPLTEIYRFRDLAVHPPADQRDPILHPVIDAGVEWRFLAFSAKNAEEALFGALSLITQLLQRGSASNPPVQRRCSELLPLLDRVVSEWEADYRQLPRTEEKEQGEPPRPAEPSSAAAPEGR